MSTKELAVYALIEALLADCRGKTPEEQDALLRKCVDDVNELRFPAGLDVT